MPVWEWGTGGMRVARTCHRMGFVAVGEKVL